MCATTADPFEPLLGARRGRGEPLTVCEDCGLADADCICSDRFKLVRAVCEAFQIPVEMVSGVGPYTPGFPWYSTF